MDNDTFEFAEASFQSGDIDEAALALVVLPNLAINPNSDGGISGGGIDVIEIRQDIVDAGVPLGGFIDSITLLPGDSVL